ncbi:hypothetical protein CRENBAI_019101 [Crenichthys baileyi]|uniref:Suppressor of cytokine signaling 2 n=1 Tax=Crenichthys baileyi TaxID=28760 RepID=A0AAV9QZV8_9TELE
MVFVGKPSGGHEEWVWTSAAGKSVLTLQGVPRQAAGMLDNTKDKEDFPVAQTKQIRPEIRFISSCSGPTSDSPGAARFLPAASGKVRFPKQTEGHVTVWFWNEGSEPAIPDRPDDTRHTRRYQTEPTIPDRPSNTRQTRQYQTDLTMPDRTGNTRQNRQYQTDPKIPDRPVDIRQTRRYQTDPTMPDRTNDTRQTRRYQTDPTIPDRTEESGHLSMKKNLCVGVCVSPVFSQLEMSGCRENVLQQVKMKDGCLLLAGPSSESPEAIEDDRRPDDGARTEESEESRVDSAMKELRKTGWYWGSLTANEAKEILQDSSEGTFLLRNSSQVDYLFTISAMTSAGPTNLRIEFRHGKFKLDSVVLVKPKLKQFDSVVHLVEHYVQLSRTTSKATKATAGPNGTVQLLLTKPVYTTTPSLQHLCRIIINRTARSVQDLPIPSRLKDYMTDYTYNV